MTRWIGFDAHKSYAYVVELSGDERLESRISLPDGLQEFKNQLDPSVQLVLEASTNSFRIADELAPHVGRLVVAHPSQTRGAVAHAANNDRNAAAALARLLKSGFVREVWLPPVPIRDLRSLVELRLRYTRQRAGAMNGLRAILRQHLIPTAARGFPNEDSVRAQLPKSTQVKTCCDSIFEFKAFLDEEIARLDGLLLSWSRNSEEARLLMSIPGIGPRTAACLIGQVGEVKRFRSPGHLCSYAGLVPRVYDSGTVRRTGGITRAGRSTLRWLMCLAAKSATRSEPFKQIKEKLCERRPRAVASTACARKLLALVWHVWTSGRPFSGLNPAKYARKLQELGERTPKPKQRKAGKPAR